MANELRIEAQLEYSKSGVKDSKRDSAYVDVSGESYNKTCLLYTSDAADE